MKIELTKWVNQFGKLYNSNESGNLGHITLEDFFKEIETINPIVENGRKCHGTPNYKKFKNKTYAYTICVKMFGSTAAQDPSKDELNGLIYIDLDAQDHPDLSKQEMEDILMTFPFISEVWDSFSGKGLAAICRTDGNMNKPNYTATHKFLQNYFNERGLKLDKQTSNYNRMFVQSNSIIRRKKFTPLNVIEHYNQKKYSTKIPKKLIYKKGGYKKVTDLDAILKNIVKFQGAIEDGNRNTPIMCFVKDALKANIHPNSISEYFYNKFNDDNRSIDTFEQKLKYYADKIDILEQEKMDIINIDKPITFLHNRKNYIRLYKMIVREEKTLVIYNSNNEMKNFFDNYNIFYSENTKQNDETKLYFLTNKTRQIKNSVQVEMIDDSNPTKDNKQNINNKNDKS